MTRKTKAIAGRVGVKASVVGKVGVTRSERAGLGWPRDPEAANALDVVVVPLYPAD